MRLLRPQQGHVIPGFHRDNRRTAAFRATAWTQWHPCHPPAPAATTASALARRLIARMRYAHGTSTLKSSSYVVLALTSRTVTWKLLISEPLGRSMSVFMTWKGQSSCSCPDRARVLAQVGRRPLSSSIECAKSGGLPPRSQRSDHQWGPHWGRHRCSWEVSNTTTPPPPTAKPRVPKVWTGPGMAPRRVVSVSVLDQPLVNLRLGTSSSSAFFISLVVGRHAIVVFHTGVQHRRWVVVCWPSPTSSTVFERDPAGAVVRILNHIAEHRGAGRVQWGIPR